MSTRESLRQENLTEISTEANVPPVELHSHDAVDLEQVKINKLRDLFNSMSAQYEYGFRSIFVKAGILGTEFSNIREIAEDRSFPTPDRELSATEALKRAASTLRTEQELTDLNLTAQDIPPNMRKDYEVTSAVLAQANSLWHDILLENPKAGSDLTQEAWRRLTSDSDPILIFDGSTKRRGGGSVNVRSVEMLRRQYLDQLIYTGSISDTRRVVEQLSSWLSEHIDYVDNPMVEQTIDELNHRIHKLEKES